MATVLSYLLPGKIIIPTFAPVLIGYGAEMMEKIN